MFQTPLISVVVLLRFLMTLGWLVTAEDGRRWNWCLGTTGGHGCQGMLAGTSPPVTCAFGPNHSDVLTAGTEWCFPHKTPFLDMFCDF